MVADQADAPGLKRSPEGWWLPENDTYFGNFASPPEFRSGPPPKRDGFYRHHLLAALKYVTGWRCAIDVGSHVGYWTYEMAQRFERVHAFEPVPATFDCLVRNTSEFANVTRYNVAVGAGPDRCTIHTDKQRPGNTGSIYMRTARGGDVPMLALDSLEFSACDFLKVDVEGFELRVLEGARKLIASCRPVISMEMTDFKFRGRYDIPEGQAQRWLLKRGYKIVWQQRPDAVFVPT